MADGLHIDLDWKQQAQAEKKRLEEEEKKRAEAKAAAAAAPAAVVPGGPGADSLGMAGGGIGAGAIGGGAGRAARGAKALPTASIGSLAASVASQAMYYLSDMALQRGGDEMANMDMAKHLIDTLGVLDEKTADRLSAEERVALDFALYQTRMRFIAVAGEAIAGQ